MIELQPLRMKPISDISRKSPVAFSEGDTARSVQWIPGKRVAGRRHVYPDLMRAPGGDSDLDNRRSGPALQDPDMTPGAFAQGRGAVHRAQQPVRHASDRSVDL